MIPVMRAIRRLRYNRTRAVRAAAVVGSLTPLLMNVMEHRQEARAPFFRVVELTDDTEDPATWGQNFPLQHGGYLKTTDQVRTKLRRQ